jgi:hypothetical protein
MHWRSIVKEETVDFPSLQRASKTQDDALTNPEAEGCKFKSDL